MTQEQKSEWFYCIVENSGTSIDQLMGFKDDETQTEFIPIFKTKEEAQQCFLLMPKDVMNLKYEIQAVIKDDILMRTKETGHKIFLMDDKGQIIKELEK
ncbi:MAG: hypothetical protein KAI40_03915 [Desulfobacterales bacterium]|nr:hypothetical protein [Desulfobacterales bacterium]